MAKKYVISYNLDGRQERLQYDDLREAVVMMQKLLERIGPFQTFLKEIDENGNEVLLLGDDKAAHQRRWAI